MINRKTILEFSTVAAIILIAAATLPTDLTIANAQGQSTDTSQQIRDYLIQAIQALDNGDNSEAIRQLQFATDQIGTFAAVSGQSPAGQNVQTVESNNGPGGSDNDEGENDDEEEDSEEGESEDADEPGDVDSNDEED